MTIQVCSQDLKREIMWVSDVCVCMHKHEELMGSRGMLPLKEIRCSEIASEGVGTKPGL